MREDRVFLVSLSESEIILISGALAQIAEARSDLADQCLGEGRLKAAKAHVKTADKANNLGERLFSLAEREEVE
jgi:hypothetical protein